MSSLVRRPRAWVALLLALAGLPLLRAQETPADLAGTWEGKVLFSNGWEGRATLVLEAPDAEGRCAGTYTLELLDEHGPGKPQEGPCRATFAGDRLTGQVQTGSFEARLGPAGSFAQAALRGSFQDGDREGVFLLWRFAGR